MPSASSRSICSFNKLCSGRCSVRRATGPSTWWRINSKLAGARRGGSGEYFFCLDFVCHFRLRFMLARPRPAKSEAVRAAKLRVNSSRASSFRLRASVRASGRLPHRLSTASLDPRITSHESRSLHVFYPACMIWDIFANTSKNSSRWRPIAASPSISTAFARSIRSAANESPPPSD